MRNKSTVSIGIPAYNEEQNIKILLEKIFAQKIHSAQLTQVIVISDGCTDRTLSACKNIKDTRLKIVARKKRLGKMARINEILKLTNADVLVLLDADVLPVGNNFIQEIITPILRNKNVGVVGADTESIKAKSFMENVIATSHNFKRDVYKSIKNGNNIYLCHGRARAFSKKFYSQLFFPRNCPEEDAYSYLLCIQEGFKFAFAPKTKVLFNSPKTLQDHIKQSTRFLKGRHKMQLYFSGDFGKREYNISKILLLRKSIKYLLIAPVEMLTYLIITRYIRFFKLNIKIHNPKWAVSRTTKGAIYDSA